MNNLENLLRQHLLRQDLLYENICETMVTQRELNIKKRHLNASINEANELLNNEKTLQVNEINIGILIVCEEKLLDQVEKYEKQLEEWLASIDENEENDSLGNFENVLLNGKKIANQLKGTIIGFQKTLENEAKERLGQKETEENAKKLEIEKQEHEHEREINLRKTEMELASRERLEMERIHLEKLKLQSETEIKTAKMKIHEVEKRSDSKSPASHRVTVKLPKLELMKFDGNVLKWQEFWDSFETTIHDNTSLQDVDKLNYLRAQLRNEAKEVIAGLEVTSASYAVAVGLLKERYGNKQLMIDGHYSQLRDIPITSTYYEKLRSTYDQIERHLRSLEALGQNVENEFMVSLIRSKLPRSILAKLEEYKVADAIWTVASLRKELKKYISTQELGDRLTKLNRNKTDLGKSDTTFNYRSNIQHTAKNGIQSTGSFIAGESNRKRCIFCGNNHWNDECNQYPDVDTRKLKVRGYCFICLKKGHLLKECTSTRACVYCEKKGNHHRSLCPNQFSKQQKELSNASLKTTETNLVAAEESVIMQTAQTDLMNSGCNENNKRNARVLLDCGSKRTYISKEVADELNLTPIGENRLTIFTFGTTKPKNIQTPLVEVKMMLKSGFTMTIKANVVPNVTGMLERRPIKPSNLKQTLKRYELADTLPTKVEQGCIDLLIGNDYYSDIVSTKRISLSDGLYLLSSKFGWILSGRTKEENEVKSTESTLALLTHSSSEISTNLLKLDRTDDSAFKNSYIEDFWALETIEIKDSPKVTDDDEALAKFNKSIKLVNDRYQVRWPWREENPDLPDNYKLCYGRLTSSIKRLKENPETMKKYNDIITDQVTKGIIERIDDTSVQGELKHYIPHHCVVKPDSLTTKLRIVYDASAKSKKTNLSLNECLHRGPVILEDLCALLLRFRTHNTAIVADIEKAFLQISLQEQDRDVTRFLWLKDINKPVVPSNINIYRFTRIPFGIISSPFILAGTICHHLGSKEQNTAKKISKDLYVDNLITGAKSDNEGLQIYQQGKQMFREMSMNLREWGSNSKNLCEQFEVDDRVEGTEMKVLGMM